MSRKKYAWIMAWFVGGALSAPIALRAQDCCRKAEAGQCGGVIDPEKIRAHVKFLSDDLLEGRGPGLKGAEIAAQYIATQFALDGLKPGR